MNQKRIKEAILFDLKMQQKAKISGDQFGLCQSSYGPRAVGYATHCLVGAMAVYYLVKREHKLSQWQLSRIKPRKTVDIPDGDDYDLEPITRMRGFLEFYDIQKSNEIDRLISLNDTLSDWWSGEFLDELHEVSNLERAETLVALCDIPDGLSLASE